MFREIGIAVFPSYIEAHPRAWLEAMATGTPIIGSSRGPGNEVIKHEKTGLVHILTTAELLAEAILRLHT